MPTLEPAYDQTEEIVFAAIEGNQLSPELAAWADAVYRNAEKWALIIYDRVRLVGSQIYEREKAVTFWKGQSEWAETQLRTFRRTEQRFITKGISTPPALLSTIQTANEIVEACRGAYELVASTTNQGSVNTLTAVFEPCEEDGYHAFIPEIPGVHSQGETIDEARENLFDALKELLTYRTEEALKGKDLSQRLEAKLVT
jgi:predicted RNase H-like HicB family nuclease